MRNNKTLRMMMMVLLLTIIGANFLGQVNLFEPSLLWLTLLILLMGLQATFTGFCPLEKVFGKKCETCETK